MKLKLSEHSQQLVNENQHIIQPWIFALRSDRYLQGQDAMAGHAGPHKYSCCLHVLEQEVGGKTWEDGLGYMTPGAMEKPIRFKNNTLPEFLTAEILDDNGMPLSNWVDFRGKPIDFQVAIVADWNDALHLTFNEIADLLEYGQITLIP